MSLDNASQAVPDAAAYRDQPRMLTDAKAMRAIAHPTRLALLEQLARHEQLTATEAAELVGESPTNCAFHLRTLAKYGFVEEAGAAPGRRRPWRRAHLGWSFDDTGHADVETDQAAQALADLVWDGWLRRLQHVRNTRHRFGESWRDLTSGAQFLAYLTPAEAAEFSEELQRLFERHRDRLSHPDQRPEGAVPVEYLLFNFPQEAADPSAAPQPAADQAADNRQAAGQRDSR